MPKFARQPSWGSCNGTDSWERTRAITSPGVAKQTKITQTKEVIRTYSSNARSRSIEYFPRWLTWVSNHVSLIAIIAALQRQQEFLGEQGDDDWLRTAGSLGNTGAIMSTLE
ncbi:hypothetical protein ON010_g6060 [Phytophthora cinnamomi]|nr:hypothetical protein ON010_g6060 [Phytophthora cinnamomi]